MTNVPDQPMSALLPGRVGMFVRLAANPGGRPALLDALHRYVDGLAEEPGTELFAVLIDPDDSDVVWLHEWFAGPDAAQAHQGSSGFAALMTELPPLLAAPPGVLSVEPLRVHLQPSVLAESI